MDKKKFIVLAVLLFFVGVGISTLVITNMKPELHKSFMLEIINVKFKK